MRSTPKEKRIRAERALALKNKTTPHTDVARECFIHVQEPQRNDNPALAIIGTPVTLTVPRFSKESPNIKLSYLRSAFIFRPSHHVFFSSLCCSSAETDAFLSRKLWNASRCGFVLHRCCLGLSRIYNVLQVFWLMHTKAMDTQLFDAPDDDKNNTHILQHTT